MNISINYKGLNSYWLAMLSGALFFVSWPPIGFPFLLFIAFIPLLFIKPNELKLSKYFSLVYMSFLITVGSTCYWLVLNNQWWYVLAILWQALLMALPFFLFYKMRSKFSESTSLLSLLSIWISLEFITLNFNYSFPWLLLGNVFANYPKFIQWYEYTGVLGGSTWILGINILLYLFLKSQRQVLSPLLIIALGLIAIPMICSLVIYKNTVDNGKEIEVVVVQPNFNPLTEKFPDGEHYIHYEKQMSILTGLADAVTTSKTKVVLFPETAIIQGVWKEDMKEVLFNKKLESYFKKYPDVNLTTGIEAYAFSSPNKNSFFTPTRYEPSIGHHELYNSMLMINPKKGFTSQGKCKLLPFSERVPLINLKFVNNMCSKFKMDNGLTADKVQQVLTLDDGIKAAPVICYESLFGNYVANYIRKGANIIFILSNDGWWGESAGYMQHFSYARIRAIENRSSVVRCANTGKSAIINKRGDIIASVPSFKRNAFRGTVTLNNQRTVYSLCGDYLGYISILSTLFIISFYYINTRNKHNN